MKTIQAVGRSLSLLRPRDRRVLAMFAIAQAMASFLDLAAVLLIGYVTVTAASLAVGEPDSVPATAGVLGVEAPLNGVSGLAVLAAVAAALLVTKSLVSVWLTRRSLRFLAHRQVDVSVELARGLFSQPLLHVLGTPSQMLGFALTGGVTQVTVVILGQSVIVVGEAALLLVLTIGLLTIDWGMTLFAALFFGLVTVLLARMLAGWAHRVGRRSAEFEMESISFVQDSIGTYRELTVSRRHPGRIAQFAALRSDASVVQADLQFISQLSKFVFELALVVGATLLALTRLRDGNLPEALGAVAVFLVAGSRMIPSLLRLQGAVVTIRAATGLGQRTFDLVDDLEAGPEVATEPQPFAVDVGETTPMAGADLVPSIRLQDVSYSYPGGGREVVRGISLDVNPGSSLALVGESGAGKSTIADLILGILEPHQGSVRIGGVAPAEAISRWPGAVGYVPQQVTMIRGSVRDNVALGVAPAEVDDAAVWRALDAVHLSPFLREHRQGLDTEVGERGARFSGGQMQRIGIARALYSTPRLLLLDEATSALDAESEHAISEILRGLNGEVTVVVIAHRLATVRSCERVAYLQGGQLVGVGTFSEVRASVAEFDRQVRLQDFSENPGSG